MWDTCFPEGSCRYGEALSVMGKLDALREMREAKWRKIPAVEQRASVATVSKTASPYGPYTVNDTTTFISTRIRARQLAFSVQSTNPSNGSLMAQTALPARPLP
jgi:hypothetical protein